MKLQKISIKNFRGLKGNKNVVDFTNSDIIFLIGQNDIGKSSFLKAYEFFVEPKKSAELTDFYDYSESNTLEIEAEFLLDSADSVNSDLRVDEDVASEPNWIKTKWADLNNIVRIKKVWDKQGDFKKYTWKPSAADWVMNGFGGLHQNLQKFAPTPIAINAMETENSLEEKVNKLINDSFLKTVKRDYPLEYVAAENAVKKLQNSVLAPENVLEHNKKINRLFKKVFSNLELEICPKNEDIKLVDAFKKNHSINVKTGGSSRTETFRQHGHGVIRQALFNFLAFLKNVGGEESNKKEYLILFEEPELFLHPKVAYMLRKSLYDLAQNSSYQVLCSSHSPLMIDISRPKSSIVRVVKNVDKTTATHQVGEELFQRNDESKKRVQMINRFNPNVCESFYADLVLLVEGDTEAIVFRDLLERFFPEKEVYVLNTGSKNNMPFFQEILTHFVIRHFIVHDTDTSDKASSWTLNKKIWQQVEKSNKNTAGLARRYVFKNNFEEDHMYNKERKIADGKPLAAFNFVQEINSLDSDKKCVVFLKDMCSDEPKINHNQQYIQKLFQ